MPKFRVLVTSNATVSTYVDVHAKDADAAEDDALGMARSQPGLFNWTVDEGNFLDPYLADPGNCAEEIPEKYHYRPLLRPASNSTLPDGVQWEYVEVPSYITARPDLPTSQYRHGVISTDRLLTLDEVRRFDLFRVH